MYARRISAGTSRINTQMTRVPLRKKSFQHPFNKILASRSVSLNPGRFRMGAARTVSRNIQEYLKNPMLTKQFTAAKPVEKVEPTPAPSLNLEPSHKGDARDLPEFNQAVSDMSEKYNIPKKFIMSVIRAESAFKPNAKSHAGALGLMQLMPGTAKDMGVKNVFDIRENVEGGVKYLRRMMDKFGQDKRLTLAAYNAGPGAVKRYGGIPPYKETTHYVAKIMKDYLGKE